MDKIAKELSKEIKEEMQKYVDSLVADHEKKMKDATTEAISEIKKISKDTIKKIEEGIQNQEEAIEYVKGMADKFKNTIYDIKNIKKYTVDNPKFSKKWVK